MSRLSLLAGAGLGLIVTSAAAVRGSLYLPGPVEPAVVHCAADVPRARAGQDLNVLVWNVQFAGSTKHHFFYDGGQAVHVSEADVAWSLDAIAEVGARDRVAMLFIQAGATRNVGKQYGEFF